MSLEVNRKMNGSPISIVADADESLHVKDDLAFVVGRACDKWLTKRGLMRPFTGWNLRFGKEFRKK
jgi:hypothetical protein